MQEMAEESSLGIMKCPKGGKNQTLKVRDALFWIVTR
jgi:hypothetical protein